MASSEHTLTDNATRAINRARKAYRHAVDMLELAETESARKRHARRAHNASRSMREAERAFAAAAFAAD